MKINLEQIYKELQAWREERGNFEIAMLETIKQISSNTGKENKVKADYEKARIAQC